MNDDLASEDLLDPARVTELDLPPKRLREIAESFEAIRRQIEKMRELDPEDMHPAVGHRLVGETSDE